MEKTIIIGEREIRLRASALIPRLYRFKFGRDLVSDMTKLRKSFVNAVKTAKKSDATEEEKREAQLSAIDLTIFENIAWLMCRQADPSVPDEPETWLDGMDGVFSIYKVLPAMLELWNENMTTTSVSAKK